MVSIATWVWLVLGVVWALGAHTCDGCPGISRLLAAVLSQAVVRCLILAVHWRKLLAAREEAAPPPKVEGASPAAVAALPLVRVAAAAAEAEACAVCLCDYVP